MKTKELINKLNNYGFKARLESTSYITYIDIESATGHDVCRLSIKDTSWFDVDLSEYGRNTMAEGDKEFISSVVNDYLATPITEREPEKKYRLEAIRHYSGPIAEKGYVKNVVCKSDYSGFEYSPVPFEFTEKQLETMKNNDPVLAPAIEAMKVEAKNDED